MKYIISNFFNMKIDIELTDENQPFIINFIENRNTTLLAITLEERKYMIYKIYSSDNVQIVILTEGFSANYESIILSFSEFKQECQRIKSLIKMRTIKSNFKVPLNLKGYCKDTNQKFIVEFTLESLKEFSDAVYAMSNSQYTEKYNITVDKYTTINMWYKETIDTTDRELCISVNNGEYFKPKYSSKYGESGTLEYYKNFIESAYIILRQ